MRLRIGVGVSKLHRVSCTALQQTIQSMIRNFTCSNGFSVVAVPFKTRERVMVCFIDQCLCVFVVALGHLQIGDWMQLSFHLGDNSSIFDSDLPNLNQTKNISRAHHNSSIFA